MSVQIAAQQLFGIAKETTRKTAEAVPNLILKITENSLFPRKEEQNDLVQAGTRDANDDKYFVKTMTDGELGGKIRNEDIGDLLYFAFGDVDTVQEASSGAYKHTYTPFNLNSAGIQSVEIPTFTAFYSIGNDQFLRTAGCAIDSLTIELGETESTFKASVKGISTDKLSGSDKASVKAAMVYSEPTQKYNLGHLVVKRAPTVAGLAASTDVISVKAGLSFEIKNNLDYDWSSNATHNQDLVANDVLAKRFSSTTTFDMIVRADTEFDNFFNETESAFEFQLDTENAGGAELGTSSGLFPQLAVTIPKALPNLDQDRPLEDYVSYKLTIDDPARDYTEGYSIKAYVQNEKSTY